MGKRKEKYKPTTKQARRKAWKKQNDQYVERHGCTLQQAAVKGRRKATKNRRDLEAAKRSLESAQTSLDSERARSREMEAARQSLEQKCTSQNEAVEAAQRHLDAAAARVRLLEETLAAEDQRRQRVEEDLIAEEERREAAERRMQEQEEMMRADEAEVKGMKEQLAELRARHEQLEKQKAKLEAEFGMCLWEDIEDDSRRRREETLPLRCQLDREQIKIHDREREIELFTEMRTKFNKQEDQTTKTASVLRQVSYRTGVLHDVRYSYSARLERRSLRCLRC